MDKPAPLHEKFSAWLRLMVAAHPRLTVRALADRLGLAPETFYRMDERPGKFNSDTLDNVEAATAIPSWLVLQAIYQGRPIDLNRETEAQPQTAVRKPA